MLSYNTPPRFIEADTPGIIKYVRAECVLADTAIKQAVCVLLECNLVVRIVSLSLSAILNVPFSLKPCFTFGHDHKKHVSVKITPVGHVGTLPSPIMFWL